jgi:hypothetical protein
MPLRRRGCPKPVAVLRPTADGQAIVERIASAITNLGLTASGVVARDDDHSPK